MKTLNFLFVIGLLLTSCSEDESPQPELVMLDRPIEVKATKGTYGNKIIINWIKMPKANNYQVFKYNQTEDDYVIVKETTDTIFIDSVSLEPLTKYFYKVKIHNSNYEYSDFSDVDYGYTSGKNYDIVSRFGSQGDGNGQFQFPEHLSIDPSGNIYVSDPVSDKVQKFSNTGNFMEVFFSTNSPRGLVFLEDGSFILARSADYKISIYNSNKELIREWGEYGSGDGQFFYFRQICIDNDKNIYVVDHNNNRIQKFDFQGNFILKWGTFSEDVGNGYFKYPWGITIFNDYVIVTSQNKVQFFTKNGVFIKQLDLGELHCYDITHDETHIYIACGNYIVKTDETGDIIEKIGEGDFSLVPSIILDSTGKIFAIDEYNRNVIIFIKN